MAGTYEQYCAVAGALDVVGDRWTLLVVRELLDGPRRNRELAEGLPGVATNLLAERLRRLEAHGIVTQLPEPDGRARTYALTARGRGLEPVIATLAAFGVDGLPEHADGLAVRPQWLALAARLLTDPRRLDTPLVLRLDTVDRDDVDSVLVHLDPEGHRVVEEATPDVIVRGDPGAVLTALRDPDRAAELTAAGRLQVTGTAEDRARFDRARRT